MENTRKMSKGKIALIIVGIVVILGIIGIATTPTAQVPDVSGQTGQEAAETLSSQGFNTIHYQNNDGFNTVENDIMKVNSQDPSSGEELATTSTITLKGDTFTDYFKAFEYEPISSWGEMPEQYGFTCNVTAATTGAELNNDLGQIAESSTGERWCATSINVNPNNMTIDVEVDSFEHLNSLLYEGTAE